MITIGHNVSSREAVDAVMAQAADAGAVILKPAHELDRSFLLIC